MPIKFLSLQAQFTLLMSNQIHKLETELLSFINSGFFLVHNILY